MARTVGGGSACLVLITGCGRGTETPGEVGVLIEQLRRTAREAHFGLAGRFADKYQVMVLTGDLGWPARLDGVYRSSYSAMIKLVGVVNGSCVLRRQPVSVSH